MKGDCRGIHGSTWGNQRTEGYIGVLGEHRITGGTLELKEYIGAVGGHESEGGYRGIQRSTGRTLQYRGI